jgi:hypothetical protein
MISSRPDQRVLLPMLACLLGVAASAQTFLLADFRSSLEEGGGAITGPMIDLALFGSAVLLIGAIVQLFRRRVGLVMSVVGFGLTVPFFSWVFAAGAWCSALLSCHGEYYSSFRFDTPSGVSIALALVSITLQAQDKRA